MAEVPACLGYVFLPGVFLPGVNDDIPGLVVQPVPTGEGLNIAAVEQYRAAAAADRLKFFGSDEPAHCLPRDADQASRLSHAYPTAACHVCSILAKCYMSA